VKREIGAGQAERTMLIITHRLETIADVQHVVWIENGRLRAQGPPGSVLPEAMRVLGASEKASSSFSAEVNVPGYPPEEPKRLF
jgi:ABC-type histidine transport system ATPase subunit